MRMPDTIPMPGPGEFCTGDFQNGAKCCLLGWTMQLNPSIQWQFQDKIGEIVRRDYGHTFIAVFNDAPTTTDEMRADVWRKAAGHFGYVVENKPWKAGKR